MKLRYTQFTFSLKDDTSVFATILLVENPYWHVIIGKTAVKVPEVRARQFVNTTRAKQIVKIALKEINETRIAV